MKSNTQEIISADVKESGLFADACYLEDGGLITQSPSPNLSGGRGFYKEGKGNRTKRSKKGVAKFSTCRQAQSIPIRQVMVCCVSSWFSHPGFKSFWLHVNLAPRLKVSKSPRAGMLEGQDLYLLKLVPGNKHAVHLQAT